LYPELPDSIGEQPIGSPLYRAVPIRLDARHATCNDSREYRDPAE
jgi:hypothetical protein